MCQQGDGHPRRPDGWCAWCARVVPETEYLGPSHEALAAWETFQREVQRMMRS